MAEADANTEKLIEVFDKSGASTDKGLSTIAGHLNEADARAEKIAATEEKRELVKKANAEKRTQIVERMFGLAGMSHKMAERSAKLAKSAGAMVKGAAAKQLTKVAGMAGSIVDWLIKGAGLLALWALFKWLSGDGAAMFTKVYEYIIKVGEWFVLLFTDPMAALEQLWNGMIEGAASIGNWIWDNTFKPLWAWFKKTFPGSAEVLEKLWDGLTGLAGGIGTWLWDTIFSPLWEWVKLLFTDPVAAFDQLLGGLKSLGTWIWNNAILPLWTWVQLLFTDPKLALAQFLQGYVTIGKWIWDKAIKPLWDWFEEQFPDAAAFIKTAWAAFMSSPIGQWIYKEVLEPFTKWLDLLFTDPTAAIDEAWVFFKDFGTWVFDKVLKPFWDWVMLLFTDPTVAIKKMWTFFTNVGTWVFDTVLKPLWTWFEGMFPDVAVKLKELWKEFTGGGDTIIGKIGTFLSGIWEWFKGMFVFDDIGGAVSALLDFVFLPTNLIVKLVGSVWEYIKGIFGFKKTEAKLPDDFSIGKMITDVAKSIWDFIKGIFGFGEGEKKKPALSSTALDKKKEEFSLFSLIGDMIDGIIDFFKNLFDIDVKGIFKSVFGTLGEWGAKAWNFAFGGDDDEEIETKATAKAKEMQDATQAMAQLAKEFKTAQLSVDNLVLGAGAAAKLEVVAPLGLRMIPAQETAGGGTGATLTQVNAPVANVSRSSTTMAVASSSVNPVHDKYGLNEKKV